MNKQRYVIGMLFCLLLVCFLSGCTSSLKSPDTGGIRDIAIPAKDFQILGLVRYESTVVNGNGEKITYDALLKAAERLGGNGLVNVMIDVKKESTTIFGLIELSSSETWYGSALAIRYTNDNVENKYHLSEGNQSLQSGGLGFFGF